MLCRLGQTVWADFVDPVYWSVLKPMGLIKHCGLADEEFSGGLLAEELNEGTFWRIELD